MIKIPWDNVTSPGIMLEVTNKCNIGCRVCYKKKSNNIKNLSEIRKDLKIAMKLRNLHTVSITGGEPTLHPELCKIVKMIKEYGLNVFLLTNGVLIDGDYLRKLKKSGLDYIMFHVDPWQKRPDLPEKPNFEDVKIRLKELTTMAYSYGIDVSVSMTLNNEDKKTLAKYNKFFFDSPEITFLFLSKGSDPKQLLSKIDSIKKNKKNFPYHDSEKEKIYNIINFYKEKFNIEPYAFFPSTNDKDIVSINYFIPAVYRNKNYTLFKIQSNLTDLLLMRFARIISGHYIQKTKQNTLMTLLRVFTNSISTFRIHKFFQFILPALKPKAKLLHKMIFYDNGPFIGKNGNLVNCKYCPVAVIRNKKLLKCCLCDIDLFEKN